MHRHALFLQHGDQLLVCSSRSQKLDRQQRGKAAVRHKPRADGGQKDVKLISCGGETPHFSDAGLSSAA